MKRLRWVECPRLKELKLHSSVHKRIQQENLSAILVIQAEWDFGNKVTGLLIKSVKCYDYGIVSSSIICSLSEVHNLIQLLLYWGYNLNENLQKIHSLSTSNLKTTNLTFHNPVFIGVNMTRKWTLSLLKQARVKIQTDVQNKEQYSLCSPWH